MEQNNDKFSTEYVKFLKIIKGSIKHRLDRIESDPPREDSSSHLPGFSDRDSIVPGQTLAQIVFNSLQSPAGINAVCNAAGEVDDEVTDGDDAPKVSVRELLALELWFYNNRYENENSENSDDKDLEDAGTVKDSIHKLLSEKLPNWVSKLFDVLNELLKLVRL